MFIKSLILKNFQKHSDLRLDFINGVNILYGSSDAGKSCIRRAIEWVVQNENIDGIRKTGTKQTSVCITLDNDIEIEKVRSQSINRYILRKDGIEKVFDSIGKSIPEEIKEALSIYPIEVDGEQIYLNSQPQIGLPFLFDKSPSFRMKLFNKLTGNDVLDTLFGQFNKDILRIKRNFKEETETFENRQNLLIQKQKDKEKAEALHSRVKTRLEKIKMLYDKYSNLLELKHLYDFNKEELMNIMLILKNLKFPQTEAIQQLKEKLDLFDKLKISQNALEKTRIGIDRVNGQLKDYRSTTLNYALWQGNVERLSNLKLLKAKVDKNAEMCYTIKRDIKIIEKDTAKIQMQYKELEKIAIICPECNGKGILLKDKIHEL